MNHTMDLTSTMNIDYINHDILFDGVYSMIMNKLITGNITTFCFEFIFFILFLCNTLYVTKQKKIEWDNFHLYPRLSRI